MTTRKPDYSLYLVTDRSLCGGRQLLDVVRESVQGGVTLVQLREKRAATRDFVELARALISELRPVGIPLLVNDRIDVALAVGAEGVHIGQSDMPYEMARELMGPEAIIGLSVETLDQAREAEGLNVDYFGVSPIFTSSTKTDTGTPWGLEGLRTLRQISSKPLVAIGAIDTGNAAEVIDAGADGIAVVSAICAASSPSRAARLLKGAIVPARRTHTGKGIS